MTYITCLYERIPPKMDLNASILGNRYSILDNFLLVTFRTYSSDRESRKCYNTARHTSTYLYTCVFETHLWPIHCYIKYARTENKLCELRNRTNSNCAFCICWHLRNHVPQFNMENRNLSKRVMIVMFLKALYTYVCT